jgi:hypothetical protein
MMGRGPEAIAQLRAAVELADALGSPAGRWQGRAVLGQALFETGDDDGAAETYREAARVINQMAAALAPEHERTLMAAPLVLEVLRAAG